MKPEEGAEEVNLNLKAINGFPEMYVDGCQSFPSCLYSEKEFPKDNPIASNRITVYSFYIRENPIYADLNPISTTQPLMIVHCGGGGIKEVFGSSFCEFKATFFTDKDTINILDGNSFSQYLLENEEDNYKIPISIAEENIHH